MTAGGGPGRKDGSRITPTASDQPAQTAPLPPDVFDAITEALADALVADYLSELHANPSEPVQPDAGGFGSPSGVDHAA